MKTNIVLTIAVFVISLGFIGCNASPNAGSMARNVVAIDSETTGNSAAPGSGNDTITMDESGIMMTVPPGFTHGKDDDDMLVSSPDGSVEIQLTISDDGDYESAREDAAEDLVEGISDVKIVEEDAEKKINGFDTLSYGGSGKDKERGKDVSWAITIIKTDKKAVLVEASGEKESLEKHKSEITALINSIKKI